MRATLHNNWGLKKQMAQLLLLPSHLVYLNPPSLSVLISFQFSQETLGDDRFLVLLLKILCWWGQECLSYIIMELMKLTQTYCSKKSDSWDVPLPCPARDNTRTNLQWRKWLWIPIAALPAHTIPGNGQLPSYTSQPADTPIKRPQIYCPGWLCCSYTGSKVSKAMAQCCSSALFAARCSAACIWPCCWWCSQMCMVQPNVHGTVVLALASIALGSQKRSIQWIHVPQHGAVTGILSSTKSCPAWAILTAPPLLPHHGPASSC